MRRTRRRLRRTPSRKAECLCCFACYRIRHPLEEENSMSNQRRKFLTGAAVAATGAATLGFPAIVKAQGPISMRWQSTWPSKDIFHEYALDLAKKVNDWTYGTLKLEVIAAEP